MLTGRMPEEAIASVPALAVGGGFARGRRAMIFGLVVGGPATKPQLGAQMLAETLDAGIAPMLGPGQGRMDIL